jgi:hypothetical protein
MVILLSFALGGRGKKLKVGFEMNNWDMYCPPHGVYMLHLSIGVLLDREVQCLKVLVLMVCVPSEILAIVADPRNYTAHIHMSSSLRPLTVMYGNHIIPEVYRVSSGNPDTTTI